MPKTIESFAARLRRLREKKGWSQNELARQAGLTSGFVTRLEATDDGRRRDPSLETARKLAAALGVSLAEFD